MVVTIFFKLKINKTIFKNCSLEEVDFTSCELMQSKFENCNLLGAKFEGTNLEKANFETAYNFSINPTSNKLKNAIFSSGNLEGLLDFINILIK